MKADEFDKRFDDGESVIEALDLSRARHINGRKESVKWDALFKRTQPQLVAAARRARQEIAQGLAKPMAYDQL